MWINQLILSLSASLKVSFCLLSHWRLKYFQKNCDVIGFVHVTYKKLMSRISYYWKNNYISCSILTNMDSSRSGKARFIKSSLKYFVSSAVWSSTFSFHTLYPLLCIFIVVTFILFYFQPFHCFLLRIIKGQIILYSCFIYLLPSFFYSFVEWK